MPLINIGWANVSTAASNEANYSKACRHFVAIVAFLPFQIFPFEENVLNIKELSGISAEVHPDLVLKHLKD